MCNIWSLLVLIWVSLNKLQTVSRRRKKWPGIFAYLISSSKNFIHFQFFQNYFICVQDCSLLNSLSWDAKDVKSIRQTTMKNYAWKEPAKYGLNVWISPILLRSLPNNPAYPITPSPFPTPIHTPSHHERTLYSIDSIVDSENFFLPAELLPSVFNPYFSFLFFFHLFLVFFSPSFQFSPHFPRKLFISCKIYRPPLDLML